MSLLSDQNLVARILELQHNECSEYELSPTNTELCLAQMEKGLRVYGPRNHLHWSPAEKWGEVRQELADAFNITTGLSASRGEDVQDELAWMIRSALEMVAELQDETEKAQEV